MSPSLTAAIKAAATATRSALLASIDEQPTDAETVKKLATIHGSLLAMTAAAPAAPPKK